MTTIRTTPMPNGGAMPVFGLGTWRMGERASEAEHEVAALRKGLDLGVTLIDTAEMYGSGGAERIVAQATDGRRDAVYVVSKVLPTNASYERTLRACEESLRNLRTDRLDLYLLHWRGPHPLTETIRAFDRLKADGKILAWGVSNFDVDDMQELETISTDCAANQVLYNLSRRGIEHDLVAWSQQRSMPIMAYSPIDQGSLAHNKAIKEIAEARGVTAAQIALAWVMMATPGIVAIPKTSRPDRVEENLKALEVRLTDEDMSALDEAFPPPRGKQSLEMI
jgi:diketogulonate reductase-like aldo/keto reductase